MFDIKKVEDEAKVEVARELAEVAKRQIKGKLLAISAAEQVVTNLKKEYEVLLRTIGE